MWTHATACSATHWLDPVLMEQIIVIGQSQGATYLEVFTETQTLLYRNIVRADFKHQLLS